MKGLLIKEYYTIKPFFKRLFVTALILFGTLMVTSKNNSGTISIVLPIVLGTSITTLMAVDEQSKWDIQVLTMPYTTGQIVAAKYIISAIGIFIGSIAGILASSVINSFTKTLSLNEIFLMALIGICIALYYVSILIPIGYKLGVKSISVTLMLVYMVPVAVFYILLKVLNLRRFFYEGSFLYNSIKFVIPIALVLIIAISISTSIKIYNKKEF